MNFEQIFKLLNKNNHDKICVPNITSLYEYMQIKTSKID